MVNGKPEWMLYEFPVFKSMILNMIRNLPKESHCLIYLLMMNYINEMEGFVSEVVSRAKIGYRRQQQKRPLHIEIDMCMIT